MNEDNKEKFELLKQKNKKILLYKGWKDNVLLQECINILKSCSIVEEDEQEIVEKEFLKRFPITFYSRVDWDNITRKVKINKIEQLEKFIDIKQNCYIIWDEMTLPCLKCNLGNVINYIEDVIAVSFDTWIFLEGFMVVIELFHNGDIIIGYFE